MNPYATRSNADRTANPDDTVMQVFIYRNPGPRHPDLLDRLMRATVARYIALFGSTESPPDPTSRTSVRSAGPTVAWAHRRAIVAFRADYRAMIRPVLVAPLPPINREAPDGGQP